MMSDLLNLSVSDSMQKDTIELQKMISMAFQFYSVVLCYWVWPVLAFHLLFNFIS
jgi:hypothetical protein